MGEHTRLDSDSPYWDTFLWGLARYLTPLVDWSLSENTSSVSVG